MNNEINVKLDLDKVIPKSPIFQDYLNLPMSEHKRLLTIIDEEEKAQERWKKLEAKELEKEKLQKLKEIEKEKIAKQHAEAMIILAGKEEKAKEKERRKIRKAKAKKRIETKKRARVKKLQKVKPTSSKPSSRKRGRPRYCFTFEQAKLIVRDEQIRSFTQYKKWWEINHPKRMPKAPNRAYKSEWKSWNDFLGVNNKFVNTKNRKFITYTEAKKYVHSLGLKSVTEWKAWVKAGNCPDSIPHCPDVVYSTGKRLEYWLSWKDFLGYNINLITDREKHENTSPVIYIAKKSGLPNGIYVINVIPGGKFGLQQHIKKMGWKLITAFYTSMDFNHSSILSKLSTYQNIDEYIINNIFDIIEILEMNLDKVTFD